MSPRGLKDSVRKKEKNVENKSTNVGVLHLSSYSAASTLHLLVGCYTADPAARVARNAKTFIIVPSPEHRLQGGGVNSTHLKYRTEGRQSGRGHSRVLVVPHSRREELISWTTKDSRRRPLFGHRHHRETSPNRPSTEGHVSTTNQALQHRLCP